MDNKKKITEIFKSFNQESIDIIILRKQENLFDNNNDDIDILASYKDFKKLKKILKKNDLLFYSDSKYINDYLYKSIPHHHFYNKNLGLNFDISFDISYRSINNQEFIPIDDERLDYIWCNKIKIIKNDFYFFQMDKYSQIIHLISHCIFDKKNFSDYYRNKISELIIEIDKTIFFEMIEPIFYKYKKRLFELIKDQKFDNIFNDYISYKEY